MLSTFSLLSQEIYPRIMVGAVVSVATGVMNPLIGKLTVLMGDDYKKLKGVRRQASFLEKEFSVLWMLPFRN